MDETCAELGEYISKISRLIQHRSRQLPMAPHQSRALSIIAEQDIHLAELAAQLQVTPRAVTEVVRALSELHLVKVQTNPKDRREKIISITPAGRKALNTTLEAQDAIARELFEPLSPEQRDHLKQLLGIVLEGSA